MSFFNILGSVLPGYDPVVVSLVVVFISFGILLCYIAIGVYILLYGKSAKEKKKRRGQFESHIKKEGSIDVLIEYKEISNKKDSLRKVFLILAGAYVYIILAITPAFIFSSEYQGASLGIGMLIATFILFLGLLFTPVIFVAAKKVVSLVRDHYYISKNIDSSSPIRVRGISR